MLQGRHQSITPAYSLRLVHSTEWDPGRRAEIGGYRILYIILKVVQAADSQEGVGETLPGCG